MRGIDRTVSGGMVGRAARVVARTQRGVVLASFAAMVFFSAMFFAAIPVMVLRSAGASPVWQAGRSAPGVMLTLLAVAGVTWLVAQFVRTGRGTPAPLAPPLRLVDAGIYGRVRNPMYLSYALVILGEALVVGSWLLVWYAILFLVVAHVYVVRVEEPQLGRRFGEAYQRYCAATPRWIPRLRVR